MQDQASTPAVSRCKRKGIEMERCQKAGSAKREASSKQQAASKQTAPGLVQIVGESSLVRQRKESSCYIEAWLLLRLLLVTAESNQRKQQSQPSSAHTRTKLGARSERLLEDWILPALRRYVLHTSSPLFAERQSAHCFSHDAATDKILRTNETATLWMDDDRLTD